MRKAPSLAEIETVSGGVIIKIETENLKISSLYWVIQ